MKYTAIALTLSLAACGGGSEAPPTPTPKDESIAQDVLGSNQTITVSNTKKVALSVSGSNNVIYVQTPLASLDILGSGNTIDIANGVTIDSCIIVGSNNNTKKDPAIKLNCSITGTSNTGFN